MASSRTLEASARQADRSRGANSRSPLSAQAKGTRQSLFTPPASLPPVHCVLLARPPNSTGTALFRGLYLIYPFRIRHIPRQYPVFGCCVSGRGGLIVSVPAHLNEAFATLRLSDILFHFYCTRTLTCFFPSPGLLAIFSVCNIPSSHSTNCNLRGLFWGRCRPTCWGCQQSFGDLFLFCAW
jgi:hypothetical protein